MFKKGIFTISIDLEFIWGVIDKELSTKDKELIKDEVNITNKLIEIFDKYNVCATWAIVGHLLKSDQNENIH